MKRKKSITASFIETMTTKNDIYAYMCLICYFGLKHTNYIEIIDCTSRRLFIHNTSLFEILWVHVNSINEKKIEGNKSMREVKMIKNWVREKRNLPCVWRRKREKKNQHRYYSLETACADSLWTLAHKIAAKAPRLLF